MRRRSFLALSLLPAMAQSEAVVNVATDGLALTQTEYARLLASLDIGENVVALLEARVAAALGKPAAVWAPSLRNVPDGARLFLESVYRRRPVKELAAAFEMVGVSMTGCFNAASGAVLAGPSSRIAEARGALPGDAARLAAVALHFFHGFEARFANAVAASEAVLRILDVDSNFEVQRKPDTWPNVFFLKATNVNAPVYHGRLELTGIDARPPDPSSWFEFHVNETWTRIPPEAIVGRLRTALG